MTVQCLPVDVSVPTVSAAERTACSHSTVTADS
jgi:hypothetical protein